MASYFSIDELCRSKKAKELGLDNKPNAEVTANLNKLIQNVLDPIRKCYGKPIIVNSGYRSVGLNKAIGGVWNSQHITGCAADIRGVNNSEKELRQILAAALMVGGYDQLICENQKWLHVSYSDKPREEFLTYSSGRYIKIL